MMGLRGTVALLTVFAAFIAAALPSVASAQPQATVTPAYLHFGDQRVGVTTPSQPVRIESTGTDPLEVTEIGFYYDDGFEVASENCTGREIAVGDYCIIDVTFKAGRTGAIEAAIGIGLTGEPSWAELPLRGSGIDPGIGVSPSGLDFGKVDDGSERTLAFEIASTGTTDLSISSIGLVGPNASEFQLTDPTACSGARAPGSKCSVAVKFTPEILLAGQRTASARIVSNGSAEPVLVSLSGMVEHKSPVMINLKVKISSPRKVAAGKTFTATAKIRNAGKTTVRGIYVRTSVSRKLAKGPAKLTVAKIEPGSTVTRKLKFKVNRSVRKGQKLVFRVTYPSSPAGGMARTVLIK